MATRSPKSKSQAGSKTQAAGASKPAASKSKTGSAAIPRPEHPRPDAFRPAWMNLNGTWEFEIDPSLSGEERKLHEAPSLAGKILVPFCPESDLSGVGHKDFMASVWYRRTFTVPADWKGQRVRIHFGACDYDTTVWINGKKAGTHRGGYSSFTFDITALLEPGKNVVSVRAIDDTRSPLQPSGKQSPQHKSFGCMYTRTTGIWQTVWLEAVPQAFIHSFRVYPDIAAKRVALQVAIDGPVCNGFLTAKATAAGKTVGSTRVAAAASMQLSIDLDDLRLWSPESPFLYDLELTLEAKGQPADVVNGYFGMRDIQIDGKKVRLNGKSVFQRLILDQGFYPDGIYTAPSDAALRRDIELSMAMGFNGARLHEKIFESRFLYWADKLGYLVWGEYPNWGLDHAHPQALERVAPEWIETVERDFNHPAIVGWCPFNETNALQNNELLRIIYRITKAMDKTRPVIDTSGYVHVETDIYDCHNYEQDPKKFAKLFKEFKQSGTEAWRNFPDHDAAYRGQPYFVSEYGGIWWNPGAGLHENSWGYGERPKGEKEVIERYRGLTEALLQNANMFALCYTQLTDVEQEQNGLYTYNRKPKFDPKVIHAITSKRAAIED